MSTLIQESQDIIDLTELLENIAMTAEDTCVIVRLELSEKPEYKFKLTWDNVEYEAKTLKELECFLDGVMNGYHIKGQHIQQGH